MEDCNFSKEKIHQKVLLKIEEKLTILKYKKKKKKGKTKLKKVIAAFAITGTPQGRQRNSKKLCPDNRL